MEGPTLLWVKRKYLLIAVPVRTVVVRAVPIRAVPVRAIPVRAVPVRAIASRTVVIRPGRWRLPVVADCIVDRIIPFVFQIPDLLPFLFT